MHFCAQKILISCLNVVINFLYQERKKLITQELKISPYFRIFDPRCFISSLLNIHLYTDASFCYHTPKLLISDFIYFREN